MGDLRLSAMVHPPLATIESLSPSVPSLDEAARESIARQVRILLRCGLSGPDLASELHRMAERVLRADSLGLKDKERIGKTTPTREIALANQVLSEWCTDPKYFDRQGHPLVLPKQGRRSIATLTRRISRTLDVERVIKYLMYTGTIVRSRRGYRVARRWVSTRGTPELNSFWSLRALLHTLRTLEHNLDSPLSTPAWFYRVAERADVPVRKVPEIHRMVDRKGMALLKWFDRYLHACAGDREPGEPVVWYGVGLQQFESEASHSMARWQRQSKRGHPRGSRPRIRTASP